MDNGSNIPVRIGRRVRRIEARADVSDNARGKLVTVSEAIVKVFVSGDNEPLWSVGEGNGPVNALDRALRYSR